MSATIRLAADGRPLAGTREYGSAVRARLEEALRTADAVTLDLAGVEDMTPSFADECFGRLSEQMGADVTLAKVSLVNAERHRSLISAVIRRRLHAAAAH